MFLSPLFSYVPLVSWGFFYPKRVIYCSERCKGSGNKDSGFVCLQRQDGTGRNGGHENSTYASETEIKRAREREGRIKDACVGSMFSRLEGIDLKRYPAEGSESCSTLNPPACLVCLCLPPSFLAPVRRPFVENEKIERPPVFA